MDTEKPPPGIVVIYNTTDQLIKGEEQDHLADLGVITCAREVYQAIKSTPLKVVLLPIDSEVELALAPYPPDQWLIFNLYEGLAGKLFEEARLAWALKATGYRFTGSGGEAIARTTNKDLAKSLLAAAGLPTPPWWLFRYADEVDHCVDNLPYLLIIKPIAEDASSGITQNSIVHTQEELKECVAYVHKCYRQAALVEKFIVGREFNIALLGDPPEVLPLAEIEFSAFDDPFSRIVSFAAKWQQDTFEYHHTPAICPAPLETILQDRLTSLALQAWDIFNCQGYARVDMRVDQDQMPHILEVNCNPDISPEAGFYNTARVAGYSFVDMVKHIIVGANEKRNVYNHVIQSSRWPCDHEDHNQHAYLQPKRTGLRAGPVA
jgi:D-alanine-D-alanine ligase